MHSAWVSTCAGGLLLGHALADPATRALLACAVPHLGFMDLGACMSSADLPLAAHEADEWGDPGDAEDAAALLQACPYHALGQLLHGADGEGRSGGGEAPWPPVLASAATHDARVPFWAPAKWVARARRAAQVSACLPTLFSVCWPARGASHVVALLLARRFAGRRAALCAGWVGRAGAAARAVGPRPPRRRGAG